MVLSLLGCIRKTLLQQQQKGGTHQALALRQVWKDPEGLLISTKFRVPLVMSVLTTLTLKIFTRSSLSPAMRGPSENLQSKNAQNGNGLRHT